MILNISMMKQNTFLRYIFAIITFKLKNYIIYNISLTIFVINFKLITIRNI